MPFAAHMPTEGPTHTHTHTHTHTCTRSRSQSEVSTSVSPHFSSPLLSAVTYHPATSAARHLLSGSVWRPFNPPSKEVFPVNEGRRDPNTKGGGGRGSDEGLAERATQLALCAGVGRQPRLFFFSLPARGFGNILHIDFEEGRYTALSWSLVGLWITGQRSERYGRKYGKECRKSDKENL